CGRCLVRILQGQVPEYRVLRRESGFPDLLACLTPVHGPLTVQPLVEAQLPKLISGDRYIGVEPLAAWAPWPLALVPLVECREPQDLGVALDIGTTTLRLLLIRLSDGAIVGEAGAYNPQIPRGADVISRIVAAEKGGLPKLASAIRRAVASMIDEAAGDLDAANIQGYVVAGNVTMIHLLLGEEPSGIRRVPSLPRAVSFSPVDAADLGWPGRTAAPVYPVPGAGGWVGGDILAGVVRAGFSRAAETALYVDLGTNGEIVFGNAEFALACACSAGPAFEGGGIRCGMRAGRGAVDGAAINPENGAMELSVIGGGRVRGLCGSGLIALADALFRAGWIDRGGRMDARVAGIRSLVNSLGPGGPGIERAYVSGNFGRYLNLPAAVGIGLLPDIPPGRYGYIDNGSLEGAALSLLSREFFAEIAGYLTRVTYVDLSDLPGYMDQFVGASFLPHTSPDLLRMG